MRPYASNSPAAIARLIAMAILADGRLDKREVAWLKEHDTAALLGVEQDLLIQALLDCCRDVLSETGPERLELLAEERLGRLADELTDKALQKVALSAMLILAKIDGDISTGEQALLRFLLQRWNIALDELVA